MVVPRTGQCNRQGNKASTIRDEAHDRRHEADALEAIRGHVSLSERTAKLASFPVVRENSHTQLASQTMRRVLDTDYFRTTNMADSAVAGWVVLDWNPL